MDNHQKRIILASLLLLALFLPVNVKASEDVEGTAPVKNEITNITHLESIHEDLSGDYIMTDNIDAKGQEFNPIGNSTHPFTGSIDGRGHLISDLYIDEKSNNTGLFGYTKNALIKDLGVKNGHVKGLNNTGGLVGHGLKTTIQSSYFSGIVSGKHNSGGLVGKGNLTKDNPIENSYTMGNVIGQKKVGGIAGELVSGNISRSYATTEVYGEGSEGGLVGESSGDATIKDSYWNNETSGQEKSEGGEPRTTDQMTNYENDYPETYEKWDFEKIWKGTEWKKDRKGNSGYPALVWEEHQYKLSVKISGEGNVEIDPESQFYPNGTKVDITAHPESGWYFDGWIKDYEGEEEEITVIMIEDRSITARFEEDTADPSRTTTTPRLEEYTLSIEWLREGGKVIVREEGNLLESDESDVNGTVTESYNVEEGTELEITAEPVEGYVFGEWSGDLTEDSKTISFTVDGDTHLMAGFAELFTLIINGPIGKGTVSPEPGSYEYTEGKEVIVEGDPKEGWYFDRWEGDLISSDPRIVFSMYEDLEITPHFIKPEIIEERKEAEDMIQEAEDMIEEGEGGFRTLQKAKRAFGEGDYEKASELASQAIEEKEGVGIIPYIIASVLAVVLISLSLIKFRKKGVEPSIRKAGSKEVEKVDIDEILRNPDKFTSKKVRFKALCKPLWKDVNNRNYYRLTDEADSILGVSKGKRVSGEGIIEGLVRIKDGKVYVWF